MPKRIPDVRRAALAAARRRVTAHGWKAFEIRSLAASCGVAAGTLYNYFPSREAIAEAVIGEDWLEASRRMRAFPESRSATENLRVIHAELAAFTRRYRSLWADAAAQTHRTGKHEVAGALCRIQKELERIVAHAIRGRGATEGIDAAFLPKFLARALMNWSREPLVSWRMLCGLLSRLIGEGGPAQQP
jgi:AcrR family transcriptional regulator